MEGAVFQLSFLALHLPVVACFIPSLAQQQQQQSCLTTAALQQSSSTDTTSLPISWNQVLLQWSVGILVSTPLIAIFQRDQLLNDYRVQHHKDAPCPIMK
jgi:hypothetical protein